MAPDDTTVDELNGVFLPEGIVNDYLSCKSVVLDKLEQGKYCLKTGFPWHCLCHSSCPLHCISFARGNFAQR